MADAPLIRREFLSSSPRRASAVPEAFEQRIQKALLDKFTGNMLLNIKDGQIIGFRVEEVVNLLARRI